MSQSISREDMFREFDALGDGVPNSEQYQRFSGLYITHELSAELQKTDPFSPRYADLVMELYLDLRGGSEGYDPQRDEDSQIRTIPDVWKDVSPWSFKDTKLVSEFLSSWAQIMRCLDLEPESKASVLEYGSGSGQLLLMLARMGLSVHAVDIDAGSLSLVRTAANLMGLDVRTERAVFGEGFADRAFDRIIFFEAFHHAVNFLPLLSRLQQRLHPGGRLIFCGEPIVAEGEASVPYPWGPRLDALSVFCIRKFGWMELGFWQSFFIEALQRKGWVSEQRPSPDCGRAHATVARSLFDGPVAIGAPMDFGTSASGWHGGEGAHRWTCGGEAVYPLSDDPRPKNVRVRMSNFLPVDRTVTLRAGATSVVLPMPAGKTEVDAILADCQGSMLSIACDGVQPSALSGTADDRSLGIAVLEIEVSLARTAIEIAI